MPQTNLSLEFLQSIFSVGVLGNGRVSGTNCDG